MGSPVQNAMASAASAVAIASGVDTVSNFEAIYVGVQGNVVVDMRDNGVNITFLNVPVGMFPVAVSKVYSAAHGTTATGLIGLRW